MNKNFKKIAASIAAAALCAVSAMSTTLNVNAAESNKHSTFRTYFYYNASLDKTHAFDKLEVSFFTYNSCPVQGPGSHGPARTYDKDALYNFDWSLYGSGSQYGELGILDLKRSDPTETRKSGMLFKMVTEAYDNAEHPLSWAIGTGSNNANHRVEYCYKILDKNGNLITRSANSQYESKAYTDTDYNVLKNPICVKAFTIRIGDINNDGVVNTTDLNLLKNNKYNTTDYFNKMELNGKKLSYYAADINGDGYVNANDQALLQSYLNGNLRLVNCQCS